MTTEDLRKLINLVDDMDDDDSEDYSELHSAMSTLADFSDSNSEGIDLDQAYDTVMRELPRARYTGVMYRGFKIDPELLSRASVLDEIKRKMAGYRRQVVSWTKDPETAKEFVRDEIGVIIQQQGTGIDVNELYHEPTDYEATPTFPEEEEVFARLDPSVSILGYAVDYENDPDNFWTREELSKFLDYIKTAKS